MDRKAHCRHQSRCRLTRPSNPHAPCVRKHLHPMKLRLAMHSLSRSGSPRAQNSVAVTEISPNVLVFATSAGNVVASIGPDGAFLIGMPSADSTRKSATLSLNAPNRFRYVVIGPQDTGSHPRRRRLGQTRSIRRHARKRPRPSRRT